MAAPKAPSAAKAPGDRAACVGGSRARGKRCGRCAEFAPRRRNIGGVCVGRRKIPGATVLRRRKSRGAADGGSRRRGGGDATFDAGAHGVAAGAPSAPKPARRCPSRGHNTGFLTFESVITYPFHPLVGQTVLVVGSHEHDGIHHLLIQQQNGGFHQIPDWMFVPEANTLAIVATDSHRTARLAAGLGRSPPSLSPGDSRFQGDSK
jgi:hypothetical protein